jgi:3-hydroxybutyryl-CoA dehydratase
VSGDFGYLHMDAQQATKSHFGGRVAHGSLLISIALGLGSSDMPQANIVAMVGTNWRFLKPVKPGTTVHAIWRLGRKRDVTNPRWGLAVWQVELEDQDQVRVLEGEVTVLVNRREVALPPASRSRRRRRGKPAVEVAAPTAEANLPEPAPADSPSPARRRRRKAAPAPAADPQPAAPEVTASVESPPADAPATTTSSRRRRRRRGGGGGGAAAAGNGSGSAAPAAEPAVPVASEPAPFVEPPRSQWAAPAPEPAKPVENNNPVSRVLGRLRRPRRAAAPTPEGTRSPSE